jgi:dihydrolipoamide dehydrogenase
MAIKELDTVVIGSGPGGYVAAIRAAQEGQNVAIVEREYYGGVCLNVGCIPSKALITASERYQEAQDLKTFGISTEDVEIDWEETQKWKNNRVVRKMTKGVEFLLGKNEVEIIDGEAVFTGSNEIEVDGESGKQKYSFKNAIVATGSTPIEIGGFEFGERVLDSTGVLALEEIPKSMVFIGGGYIGSELAGVYSRLGTDVTILEGMGTILGGFDKDMVKLVERQFKKEKTDIVTNAMAKKADVKGNKVTVTYEVDGKEETIDADYVAVTVGRRPNTNNVGLDAAGVEVDEKGLVKVNETGQTSNKNIYAIGDIVPGAALAHKASYEGKVAAEAIAGKPAEVDYNAMPAVAFTSPELASTGLTEDEAKEEGLEVTATKFPFGGNGRAVSLDQADGFVRLVTTKDDNTVVGAQIAGASASEIIGELTLAVESGMNAQDIALTIHAHPTVAETVMDAAEGALGQPIHM